MTFCDIVYLESESLSVHGISPKHTARAILRQDLTVLIFTRPFLNIICANSLQFSCLLWQPVINFSAATMKHVCAEKMAQFRTQLDFKTKTAWTSNDQISIPGRQENRLEVLRTFKKKCGYIFKRSVVNRFQTKENVFWYSGTRLGRTWRPKDLRQLRLVWRCRQCSTTTNWSSGTKLERAVSPECNQNVDSKRNFKNEGKKLERQPLQRLQLCRWRLDKRHGKIIFLRWICWTTKRTIPRKRKHFRKRWSYDNWQGLRKY